MTRIGLIYIAAVSSMLTVAGCGGNEKIAVSKPGVPGLRAGDRSDLDADARRFMDFVKDERALPNGTKLVYSGGCRKVDAGGLHCVIQWRNDDVRGDAIGDIDDGGSMTIRTAAERRVSGDAPVGDPTQPPTP